MLGGGDGRNRTGRTTLPQTKNETKMLHMEEESLAVRRVTRRSPHPTSGVTRSRGDSSDTQP